LAFALPQLENGSVSITRILAMFISYLHQRVVTVLGTADFHLSFSLPPSFKQSTRDAFVDATSIAGIDVSKVQVFDASDCLVTTYGRKLMGLIPTVQASLAEKIVLLIDMGHTQSTVIVCKIDSTPENVLIPRKLSVAYDGRLGSYSFDLMLWEYFAKKIETKTKEVIEKGSKRGIRLLGACERLRKLLSQLPTAHVSVENMSDNYGDETLQLTRDELTALCEDSLLKNFTDLIQSALTQAAVTVEDVHAVEALGGGMRMPFLQVLVLKMFQSSPSKINTLGAKFDDASLALGAALLAANKATAIDKKEGEDISEPMDVSDAAGVADKSVKMTEEELLSATTQEKEMQEKDTDIRLFLSAKNSMESFILEMRMAPKRKFGNTINAAELNQVLDENENWLWDHSDDSTLEDITKRSQGMRLKVEELCKDYFAAVEEEKKELDRHLDEEAVKAAAERAANGEEDEDHDNRKLRKADRMRLVVKNKDDGTELFKGKNYRHAAARYQKALAHCAKFFDLSGEDEAEVKAMKLSLYLNLATCYIKLEVWEQVIRNCEDALNIDPVNVKALFRRSSYYEHKKDWEKAMADIKKLQELSKDSPEDVLVTRACERIKKEQQKEKDKEKKMWGKAFS